PSPPGEGRDAKKRETRAATRRLVRGGEQKTPTGCRPRQSMHDAHRQGPEQLVETQLFEELLPRTLRVFFQAEMGIGVVRMRVHVRLAAVLVNVRMDNPG